MREWQTDGVLLSQGGQLLEELAEDYGAVDSVLHPQGLRLFLQAGGSSTAAEQSTVQGLAPVPYVSEGQLSGVSGPSRAVGVTEDEVAQRWFTTLHWKQRTFRRHLGVIAVIMKIYDMTKAALLY